MSYTRTTWRTGETPLSAGNMNNIEDGIEEALTPATSESNGAMSAADKAKLDAIWNILYPVGCYFETSNTSFNPSTAWGGTWELEESGRVHVSAGTGYTAGSKGGNKDAIVPYHTHTHTNPSVTVPTHGHGFTQPSVTVPAHTHSFTQPSITGGSCTISSSGGHSHTVSVKYKANYLQGGSNRDSVNSGGDSTSTSIATIASGTGAHTHTVPSHSHTASGGAVGTKAAFAATVSGGKVSDRAAFAATVSGGGVSYAGTSGNLTNANMQPYIVVNRWHRTA